MSNGIPPIPPSRPGTSNTLNTGAPNLGNMPNTGLVAGFQRADQESEEQVVARFLEREAIEARQREQWATEQLERERVALAQDHREEIADALRKAGHSDKYIEDELLHQERGHHHHDRFEPAPGTSTSSSTTSSVHTPTAIRPSTPPSANRPTNSLLTLEAPATKNNSPKKDKELGSPDSKFKKPDPADMGRSLSGESSGSNGSAENSPVPVPTTTRRAPLPPSTSAPNIHNRRRHLHYESPSSSPTSLRSIAIPEEQLRIESTLSNSGSDTASPGMPSTPTGQSSGRATPLSPLGTVIPLIIPSEGSWATREEMISFTKFYQFGARVERLTQNEQNWLLGEDVADSLTRLMDLRHNLDIATAACRRGLNEQTARNLSAAILEMASGINALELEIGSMEREQHSQEKAQQKLRRSLTPSSSSSHVRASSSHSGTSSPASGTSTPTARKGLDTERITPDQALEREWVRNNYPTRLTRDQRKQENIPTKGVVFMSHDGKSAVSPDNAVHGGTAFKRFTKSGGVWTLVEQLDEDGNPIRPNAKEKKGRK